MAQNTQEGTDGSRAKNYSATQGKKRGGGMIEVWPHTPYVFMMSIAYQILTKLKETYSC